MRNAISLICASTLSLAGCDGSREPPVVTRTDSSGVEIVTSHTSGSPTPVWRISRRPVLELGALDGPDELTFGNIRSVGRMPDGRIYVGDEDADGVGDAAAPGPCPSPLPALSPEVHVDALGYIWIPRYHFGGRSASEWEVFDSTGVWVGPVPTPEDFDVHQIGASEIIGVRRGEFDVPYVQVYGLRRE